MIGGSWGRLHVLVKPISSWPTWVRFSIQDGVSSRSSFVPCSSLVVSKSASKGEEVMSFFLFLSFGLLCLVISLSMLHRSGILFQMTDLARAFQNTSYHHHHMRRQNL